MPFMKNQSRFLIACSFLVTITGCRFISETGPGGTAPDGDVQLLVIEGEVKGVILPDGDWIPDPAQVMELEMHLPAFLLENRNAFNFPSSLDEILPRHHRQYWGLQDGGPWVIYINSFCDAFGFDWQKERVDVLDGGDCYFQLKYDLQDKRFFDLRVNGEA